MKRRQQTQPSCHSTQICAGGAFGSIDQHRGNRWFSAPSLNAVRRLHAVPDADGYACVERAHGRGTLGAVTGFSPAITVIQVNSSAAKDLMSASYSATYQLMLCWHCLYSRFSTHSLWAIRIDQ